MTMILPTEKLNEFNFTLKYVVQAIKREFKEMQTHFGLLNFACKVVEMATWFF